jgi:UDP-N-acetyl-D-mannosaminuronic acid dehydrogenase
MHKVRKIGIMGLGYIGLPTAVVFANGGLQVHGVDIRKSVVDAIARGQSHFSEPGLDELLQKCLAEGRLKASMTPVPCDAFIIAAPTPFKDNHVPDLSHVEAITDAIAPVLEPGNLVILESTVPVGATEALARQIAKRRPDLNLPLDKRGIEPDVYIAHCPERVLPGQILHELVCNSRVVGGISPHCTQRAIELYRTVVQGECLGTSARTAELAKLSENAFRDVNIAFANELSMIAKRLDIDVSELITLANMHPRVNILKPGAGVGGHCIAVDPWFIVNSAPEEAQLIHRARLVNDSKPKWVADQILQASRSISNPRVGCLGLTYKADVDDMRHSASIEVIKHLLRGGATKILVHDPLVRELPDEIVGSDVIFTEFGRLMEEANVAALLTDHQMYRTLNFDKLAGKILIDPCGAWRQHFPAFTQTHASKASE